MILKFLEGFSTGAMYSLTSTYGPHPKDTFMDIVYLTHWFASFLYHTTCSKTWLYWDLFMIQFVIIARLYRACPQTVFATLPYVCYMIYMNRISRLRNVVYSTISMLFIFVRSYIINGYSDFMYVGSMTAGGACFLMSFATEKRGMQVMTSALVSLFHILIGYAALLEESHYAKMI